jgi:hypothetical protein
MYSLGLARPTASASSAQPSPEHSLAGSRAGEGRRRPGRTESEPKDETGEPSYTATAPTTPPQETPPQESPTPQEPDITAPDPGTGLGTEHPGTGAEASAGAFAPVEDSPVPPKGSATPARRTTASRPTLEILPLGSGLVLVGLGLGLALLALRLRRG